MKILKQQIIGLFTLVCAISSSANAQQCTSVGVNEDWCFNMSTSQGFYWTSNIIIDGEQLEYNDIIGVFMVDYSGDSICVAWSHAEYIVNGFTIFANGNDFITLSTEDYPDEGDIPFFLIYDSSSGNIVQLNEINIPPYSNNSFLMLDEISIITTYGCSNPEASNYNIQANVDDGSCTFAPEILLTPPPIEFTNGETITLMSRQDLWDYGVIYDADNSLEELTFTLNVNPDEINLVWDGGINSNPTVSAVSDFTGTTEIQLCISDNESTVCASNIIIVYENAPEEEVVYELNNPCTSLSDYNSILLDLNPIQSRGFVEGWNMFGFPCKEPRSASETFSDIISDVFIIKNNDGIFYWPEFGYDGIGELIPLEGYQANFYNSVGDFIFCDYSIVFPDVNIEGCTDCDALNYNPFANSDDGSCVLNQHQIGDYTQGGIVFYVDETGEHGLVAAEEDLPEMYPWGCSGNVISGADGLLIGTGLQNTLDIVFGCSESPIAASMALEHEHNGYSDWYLPSFDELMEMFNTIGNAGPNGNVGLFQDDWYISSSEFENDPTNVWGNNFSEIFPNPGGGHKSIPNNIRLIRSF